MLEVAGSLKPDELDQSTIDELISAHLKQQLEVLTEEDLTAAVHNFVDKDEKASGKWSTVLQVPSLFEHLLVIAIGPLAIDLKP